MYRRYKNKNMYMCRSYIIELKKKYYEAMEKYKIYEKNLKIR